MATFQLVFTRPTGGQSANPADFSDDGMAIADAKLVLSDDVVSISIGRGALVVKPSGLGSGTGTTASRSGRPIQSPKCRRSPSVARCWRRSGKEPDGQSYGTRRLESYDAL
jgi:hypothetical protein